MLMSQVMSGGLMPLFLVVVELVDGRLRPDGLGRDELEGALDVADRVGAGLLGMVLVERREQDQRGQRADEGEAEDEQPVDLAAAATLGGRLGRGARSRRVSALVTVALVAPHTGARRSAALGVGRGRSLPRAGRSVIRSSPGSDSPACRSRTPPFRRRRRSRASRRSGSVPSCPSSQWPASAPSRVVTRRVTPISVKRRRYPRGGGPASLMGDLSRRSQCSRLRVGRLANARTRPRLADDDPGIDVDAAVADRPDLRVWAAERREMPARRRPGGSCVGSARQVERRSTSTPST